MKALSNQKNPVIKIREQDINFEQADTELKECYDEQDMK